MEGYVPSADFWDGHQTTPTSRAQVLDAIAAAWAANPNQRLIQLLINTVPNLGFGTWDEVVRDNVGR